MAIDVHCLHVDPVPVLYMAIHVNENCSTWVQLWISGVDVCLGMQFFKSPNFRIQRLRPKRI